MPEMTDYSETLKECEECGTLIFFPKEGLCSSCYRDKEKNVT